MSREELLQQGKIYVHLCRLDCTFVVITTINNFFSCRRVSIIKMKCSRKGYPNGKNLICWDWAFKQHKKSCNELNTSLSRNGMVWYGNFIHTWYFLQVHQPTISWFIAYWRMCGGRVFAIFWTRENFYNFKQTSLFLFKVVDDWLVSWTLESKLI